MKITYIVNARIPTEKAHGIQIIKMCEAFANVGNEVELIVPNRINYIKDNPFEYFSVKENFKIKKLPVLDFIFFDSKISFLIESFTFSISLFFYLLFLNKKNIIYVRGESIFVPLILKKKNIFWETHIKPDNVKKYKKVFKNVDGLITVTSYYKKEIEENFGISKNNILNYPDGVALESFDFDISKNEARNKLNLPIDKKIVLYLGHLYEWKGVQVLADASRYLTDDCIVVFVGGTKEDIISFRNKNDKLENILIVGHRPYSEVPYWQKAADVLVLPNSAKSNVSMYYTSPMKLFEYMAVKRPIVSSDLPSLRDVLNDKNSVLVEPDNPQKLAGSIKLILSDESLTKRITEQAFVDVKKYTWENRAREIVIFIKKLTV